MTTPSQVIISYYDRRPVDHLHKLLTSMQEFSAGVPFQVCIVVNATDDAEPKLDLSAFSALSIDIHYRRNQGMNIGAWDYGWRTCPDAEHFLFLQDDCYIVRDNWLQAFVESLQDTSIGLLGESINNQWDHSWGELKERESNTQLPEHLVDGKPANRVDVYTRFMQQRDIDPGNSGRHVRALCWASRRSTLEAIDGFPTGTNYGECIGAEIAVSRKMVQLRLRLDTVDELPFQFVRHSEWNQSEPGGEFTKLNATSRKLKQLQNDNQRLNASLATVNHLLDEPRWKLARALISGKLKKNIASALERAE